jgi:hypothetical protein
MLTHNPKGGRMLRRIVVLVWIIILAATCWFTVSQAKATTIVHLKATPQMQTWTSKKTLPSIKALNFEIRVGGRDISRKGTVTSKCTYMLIMRRLAVKLSNCGAPSALIRLRYFGSRDFTFVWWLGN